MPRVGLSKVSRCGIELRAVPNGRYIRDMSSTTIDESRFRTDAIGSDKSVFTARPDMRILKPILLGSAIVLAVGAAAYLLPIVIDRDYQVAGSAVITGIGLVGII